MRNGVKEIPLGSPSTGSSVGLGPGGLASHDIHNVRRIEEGCEERRG